MGICASCLGLGRRESHGDESTRLLDDDIYQSGYGYGGVSQRNGPDPEDVKREREALDGICQRTSDSVMDVWSAQQPYMTTAQRPKTSFSSRVPSAESAVTQILAHSRTATPTQPPPSAHDEKEQGEQRPNRSRDAQQLPAQGEFANMKYVAYPDMKYPLESDPSAAPKHWGEVVTSTRRGKKALAADNMDDGNTDGGADVFGVLNIK